MEILGGIVVLTIMVVLSGLKVVKEHSQLVIYRFGRVIGSRGPGLQLVLPMIDQSETIDTRIVTLATPLLDEMTLDHITIKISVVCLYQIVDAQKAVSKIDNAARAVSELVQATLRTVVSQHDLKHIMSDRGRMNSLLKSKLDKQTGSWGVRISVIEIKEIKIPKEMKKILAHSKRHHGLHHGEHHGEQHGEHQGLGNLDPHSFKL
jgi:regulator of protease activity HflC (stomatin/prohibitin superfamily)